MTKLSFLGQEKSGGENYHKKVKEFMYGFIVVVVLTINCGGKNKLKKKVTVQ